MNILVEDLRTGQVWNGKTIISIDAKEDSATVIFWLEGESEARSLYER